MKITFEEIKRLEKLSALSSDEEKLKSLVKDFEQIAEFVEQVRMIDIEELDSCNRVLTINELREDNIEESFSQNEILMNAPEKNDEAFIVPRVVD